MNFKDHFSDNSSDYKSHRPTYPPELFKFLADLCSKHERVWDVATGNGQAAIALANYFDHVVATDGSADQIAQTEPHDKIDYKVEPAELCSLPDHSFDLITVAQAVHWFDFASFNAQVKRVAKPTGLIAIWGYGLIRFDDPKLDGLIRHFYNHVVHKHWPPERAHVVAQYRTIPFPFAELSDLPKFEIRLEHSPQSLLSYLSTWSGVKNYRIAEGLDPLEQLSEKFDQLPSKSYAAHLPVMMRVGKVH
ncbi:MAG: class I SAM-dependent methyltransferase [Cyclobacteriaceae bacterium]